MNYKKLLHLFLKYGLIELLILNHHFTKMQNSFIKYYYDFFDKKIEDSTLVVGLIGAMIFLAGFLSNTTANYKSNILEYNPKNYDSIVLIDGKKYKLVFEEIK